MEKYCKMIVPTSDIIRIMTRKCSFLYLNLAVFVLLNTTVHSLTKYEYPCDQLKTVKLQQGRCSYFVVSIEEMWPTSPYVSDRRLRLHAALQFAGVYHQTGYYQLTGRSAWRIWKYREVWSVSHQSISPADPFHYSNSWAAGHLVQPLSFLGCFPCSCLIGCLMIWWGYYYQS